jgi:3-oxoadipate enol-lactonase
VAGGAGDAAELQLGRPPLPPERRVHIEGLGTLVVRETGERHPDRPSVVLLHGWTATADLNWFPSYAPLGRHHHVLAHDHRGHGRGLRRPERFSLDACADDVVAVADAVGVERIVPVGYSMGGLVAQLVARRHPDRVAGLVLAATSRNFRGTSADRLYFGGMSTLAAACRLAPGPLREQAFARLLEARLGKGEFTPWGATELTRHDLRTLLEAGAAIGTFSSHHWAAELDVPAAVIITTADTKVPAARQRKLAHSLPRATVFEVDGDHHVCSRQPERFVPALVDAVATVMAQIVGPGPG